jgi:hypothetical protein
MGLKFSPPKNVARYAYAVEYERSQTKFATFNDIGSAKLGLQANMNRYASDFKAAYLLENVEGQWYVLHTVNKDDEHMPWQKEVEVGGWRSSYKTWRAVPMTREQYAEWRVQVERERLQEKYDIVFT